MINWEELKEKHTLEDFYNILCRNKPSKKSKNYNDWETLEVVTYLELLEEEERPQECMYLIDKIIEFLQKQRKQKGL